MDDIRLTRTGDAPLLIRGELVAESDGHRQAGRERNRWHDLAVYHLADGRYAVAIAYCTQWQGELDHHQAFVVADPAGVAAVLRDYEPGRYVTGYPAGDAYRERQDALLADVTRRYRSQVSDVLDSDEFAVAPVEGGGDER